MNEDFPQYDLPTSVPGDAPPPTAPTSTDIAEPAAPPATPPPDPTVPWEAMHSRTPEAIAEAAPAPQAPPQAAPRPAQQEGPPLTAVEQSILQNQRMLAAIAERMAGVPPQPQGQEPPAERDAKSIAVEQALVKHIPQLAPLLAALSDPNKAQALHAILQQAPQHQANVQAFYADFADQTAAALSKTYAEAYGLDVKTVDRDTENDLTDQFARWIERPENVRLLQRYEMGDLRVVGEFSTYFRQRFVAPAARQGVAQVAARGRTVGALPRGGGSTIPTPQQTAPRASSTPAKDIFTEAWHEMQGTRAAG